MAAGRDESMHERPCSRDVWDQLNWAGWAITSASRALRFGVYSIPFMNGRGGYSRCWCELTPGMSDSAGSSSHSGTDVRLDSAFDMLPQFLPPFGANASKTPPTGRGRAPQLETETGELRARIYGSCGSLLNAAFADGSCGLRTWSFENLGCLEKTGGWDVG